MDLRKCLLALAALFSAANISRADAEADPVRAMTFNIRNGRAPDGENAWPHRSSLVVKVIRDFDPDVLGLQEAQRSQLDELAGALPEYATAGVGREAGGGGEYSAIFYRRARFDLSDAGTFWLSDAPATPGSRTWGNNLPRICTWVRLFDRTSDRRFVLFNTHWDHESQPARLHSGRLLAKELAALTASGDPAIVMGDFNCGERDPAMAALTGEGGPLKDTLRAVSPDETSVGTFNGFGKKLHNVKIDAVLTTPHWRVLDAEIVRTRDGERYPSDHFPLTATVTLQSDGQQTAPVSSSNSQ